MSDAQSIMGKQKIVLSYQWNQLILSSNLLQGSSYGERSLQPSHFSAFARCMIEIGAEGDIGRCLDMDERHMKALIELMRISPDTAEGR